MAWADIFRTVILGEAIGLTILVIDLLLKYFAAISERSWRTRSFPWTIPIYVVGILCLVIHVCAYTVSQIGQAITFKTVLAVSGFTLLLVGTVIKRKELINERYRGYH